MCDDPKLMALLTSLQKRKNVKNFALSIAGLCLRNTVIEEFHKDRISPDEMMAFNKEVANKLYTVFSYMFGPEKSGHDPSDCIKQVKISKTPVLTLFVIHNSVVVRVIGI